MNGTERTMPFSRAIPSRRIAVDHPSQLPADYSSTPGGTIFSTTPGGTRIIYERKFLLELRNSPLAKTPPSNLPLIPGVTCDENTKVPEEKTPKAEENGEKSDLDDSNTQFEMDI